MPSFQVIGESLQVREKPSPFGGDPAVRANVAKGELLDVVAFEGDWVRVHYGRSAVPGQWWTKAVGWVPLHQGKGALPFVHLRGLVPAIHNHGG